MGQGSSEWSLLKGPSAFPPAAHTQCKGGEGVQPGSSEKVELGPRSSPQSPTPPHGWRLHVAVAPCGLTLYLPLPAAPLAGASSDQTLWTSSFIASKGPGPSLPAAPPQPLLGDQLLPLDPVVSQLLRLQCHPRQAGKEECGLISAGMCPLCCPQRGEGTETKPTRAQETQEDSGLGDRPLGPPGSRPHPAAEALLHLWSHSRMVSLGAGERDASCERTARVGRERTQCLSLSP